MVEKFHVDMRIRRRESVKDCVSFAFFDYQDCDTKNKMFL